MAFSTRFWNDLHELVAVADHLDRLVRRIERERDGVLGRERRQRIADMAQHGDKIDAVGRPAVDAHLGAAERQEIVDQPPHAPRLVEHDRAGTSPSPRGSLRAGPSSVSMKPVSEASGVRSSWLALATKSARMRAMASRSETSSKVTRMKPSASPGDAQRAEASRNRRWSLSPGSRNSTERRPARQRLVQRLGEFRPAEGEGEGIAGAGRGKERRGARCWRSGRCRRRRARRRPAATPRASPSSRCPARPRAAAPSSPACRRGRPCAGARSAATSERERRSRRRKK